MICLFGMGVLVLWFVSGVTSWVIASSKGHDGSAFFFLTIFFGPLPLLIAICLPDKAPRVVVMPPKPAVVAKPAKLPKPPLDRFRAVGLDSRGVHVEQVIHTNDAAEARRRAEGMFFELHRVEPVE